MLKIILDTLIAYKNSNDLNHEILDKEIVNVPEGLNEIEIQLYVMIQKYLRDHTSINTAVATKLVAKSSSTVRRYLSLLVQYGLLEAHGSNKNRTYTLKK